MDGLKPGRGTHGSRTHARPHSVGPHPSPNSSGGRNTGEKYWLVRSLGKLASKKRQKLWDKFKQTEFAKWPDKYTWRRAYVWVTLALFIFSTLAGVVQPFLEDKFYGVTKATRAVLPEPREHLGTYLKYDAKEKQFAYNDGYTGNMSNSPLAKTGQGEPRINAVFAKEASKGMTISDPINKIDFKMSPKFKLNAAKQDRNQLFYPLTGTSGYLVYTAQIASIKEDIVLEKAGKDSMSFEYDLDLANGLEAKLEKNGKIGIYGTSLPINGNVATGSEKDAKLLEKARESSEKNKLLFVIPAPVVVETGKDQSSVAARYELEGNKVTIVAENLKAASYPLSIDPSVYVQSAVQLMKGNNETNVEFDVTTEQFKKGTTTGARIDEWSETNAMNDAVWDQATAAAGGYVYRAGGKNSRILPRVVSKTITETASASATLTINMPAERPTGDLYIMFASATLVGTSITSGSPATDGWTTIKTYNNQLGAYYRYDTSGSLPASYSYGISSAQQTAAVVLRIKDFNTSTPINTSQNVNNAGAPLTYPSVTPNQQGTLVVAGVGYINTPGKNPGFSPGTDWSDVAYAHTTDTADNAASGIMVSALDLPPTSSVATGSQNVTTSSGASSAHSSATIAVNGNSYTTATNSTLQWARFNSANGTIESPAPGSNGTACGGWCTNTAYNLPSGSGESSGAGLIGMSMVAYNGYLYAMGGSDGTDKKKTIYVAKLGANGEPSLWHPSDPDQADQVYWYQASNLGGGTSVAYHSAVANNGRMYVLGGDTDLTSASSGSTTNTYIADILPNGTLGSWSSGTALPTAAYGASAHTYNNYLYFIGGQNNGTMLANASSGTVYYTKLNSDGTMNSWNHAAADGTGKGFATARAAKGGVMTAIWGGYLYLAGGCSVVNASGHCTTIMHDTQIASINADGTLDEWNTIANLRNQRLGYNFIAWQDSLYRFGGCSKHDSSNGDCYATHISVQYGNINQDGDASTVSITQASGSGSCVDPDPYHCNLPPVGDGAGQAGQMLSGTAILNGYLYVIGGCTTFDNSPTTDPDCATGTAASGNISYVAISSDGKLKQPPTCSGTPYGSWCVDSTNQINGTAGVAAPGVTVFGGYIYVVGGLDGSGNLTNIYRNSTNADGSLVDADWDPQTFSALGVTENISYTFAYARANPSSSTYLGNLYIFGGCDSSSGAGCNGTYRSEVWKCNILASGALETADANDCDTANQMQIDSEGGAGNQGLGIHAGTVYANYIYLIGGLGPAGVDRDKILYAKFDNNNNVVAVSGSAWVESPVTLNTARRRGTAFGYNGYIYAVGGFEATSSQVLDTIEFVKINVSNGSLVSSDNKFQLSSVTINQRWGLALAVSNSFAYAIGGCNVGGSPNLCSSFDPSIQTFQMYNNDSGAPGGFTTEADTFATDRVGASAAVYNGYLYIAGGCTGTSDCSTATGSVQYAQLDATGAIPSNSGCGTAWCAGNSLPSSNVRAWGQLEVAGGSLYYIGGQDSSGDEKSDIYYSSSISSGNPSWSTAAGGIGDTASQAAQDRTKFSATVWNNRIYVVGGLNDSAAVTADVYISPQLNSGGDIGANSWTTGTSLSVARSGAVAIAYANNLYVYGGQTASNYLSDSQFTQINTDGTMDSWTYTTSLPMPLTQADGFAVNGYMYLFGGRSSTNDCSPRTLISPISANTTIASGNNPTGIGEWYQTNKRYDTGRYGAAAAYYQGKAYVLGGACQGTVMQDDFDATYTAGEWSNVTGMTAGTTCQSTSTSNVFYLTTGGTTNQAATKSVNVSSGGTIYFKLYMPLADTGGCFRGEQTTAFLTTTQDNVELEYNNNGGGWNQIGADYVYNTLDPLKSYAVTIPAAAQGTSTQFRWIMRDGEASDSFAIEDVSIVATGNTTLTYTDTKRVQYTSLLSQPQVANYSRLIDAGRDVFPTKWLLNGLDNSIGARWQFSYRSMNDSTVTDADKACGGAAMTSYGQLTNFGNVTLANPETYTVKNGAGTDIKCSRYFFMNISIDASQTYGYPDDIDRGPTLDNLTLFFKSNPGQRLIHGKTFIEGTQQPLDTQPGP